MAARSFVLVLGVVMLAASGCTSSAGPTNPTAPPSTFEQQLWTIATKAAHDADSEAATAGAVRTTERAAARFITARRVDDQKAPGGAVWLVQVRGTHPFSCECDVHPSRSGDTTADYMLIIVDGSARRMIAGAYLYAARQPIEALGERVDLPA